MKKNVIILRGCPSSGKSTVATLFCNSYICCADDYFYENGVYSFDVNKLGEAHELCRKRFVEAIEAQRTCIVVANTNSRRKEWKFYEDLAKENGYRVTFLVVENRHDNKNSHFAKIPQEVLDQMEERIKNSLKLS